MHYALKLEVNIDKQSIVGQVEMRAIFLGPKRELRLNLDSALSLDSVVLRGMRMPTRRSGSQFFVTLPAGVPRGYFLKLMMHYHGSPKKAAKPPWEGGMVWRKDSLGRPWVGVACQQDGASTWWPCHDVDFDEPDSGASMTVVTDAALTFVGNGLKVSEELVKNGTEKATTYAVTAPINLYNITMNIGHYLVLDTIYKRKDGSSLKTSYAALDYHAPPYWAYMQQEAEAMLDVNERLYGRYPWGADGYKLCETSYWGMEHQSCIAYGNALKRNAYGFDFIIVHESGHEWWGNKLSIENKKDMWVHEAFCTYSEVMYLEARFGKEMAMKYLTQHIRPKIKNEMPMLPKAGMKEGEERKLEKEQVENQDTDMYYKGAWMLHGLRMQIGNEQTWLAVLQALLTVEKQGQANTEGVLKTIDRVTGKNYSEYMRSYLMRKEAPTLLVRKAKDGRLWEMKWKNLTDGFGLPVALKNAEGKIVGEMQAGEKWRKIGLKGVRQPLMPDNTLVYFDIESANGNDKK